MTEFSSPSQPPAPRYGELDPSRQYQPTPYPPAPYPQMETAAKKPGTLGLVALIVAIVVTVFSLIMSVLVGVAAAPMLKPGMTFSDGFAAGEASDDVGLGLMGLSHLGFGTAFGLWALIQGIFAVVLKRGRGYGIAAIVIASAAPIVSFIVYVVTAAATARGLAG